jgi:hypothetical protein
MLYLEKHIIRLNEILALSALLQAGSENVGPNRRLHRGDRRCQLI